MRVAQACLTHGNINNFHIYFTTCTSLNPSDARGGSNGDAAGEPISVAFVPGGMVKTDYDATKNILRVREPVRRFMKQSKAKSGDVVMIVETGGREFFTGLKEEVKC